MTDIFSGEPAAPAAAPIPPVESTIEQQLLAIKNEAGQPKYQNVTEALKALQHSQEFIPTLKTQLTAVEQELAQAKEEIAKAKKLEDVVAQLTASHLNNNGEQPPAASGLDQEAVEKLVQRQLATLETQKAAKSNVDVVQSSLTAKYGDKTAEVVAAKAAELGTTPKLLGDLAAQSPQMVLALFGSAPVKNLNPSTSSVVIPPTHKPDLEVKRPDKSVLVGATNKEQIAHFSDIREKVHARLGVTT
jgi:hypothetical protein